MGPMHGFETLGPIWGAVVWPGDQFLWCVLAVEAEARLIGGLGGGAFMKAPLAMGVQKKEIAAYPGLGLGKCLWKPNYRLFLILHQPASMVLVQRNSDAKGFRWKCGA